MNKRKNEKIFIIGAGFAGRQIALEIKAKGILGEVTAFIDDDPEKIGTLIDGIRVYGPIKDIKKIQSDIPADEALIAIPGATNEQIKKIYAILKLAYFTKIRILPGISQIIDGDAHLIQIREICAQDFLSRDPVTIPLKESLKYLRGKRVLITGAGGSIGSELSRQLLSGGAQRLYLFDHGENNLCEIEKEMRLLQEEGVGEAATIVPVIGDFQDKEYTFFLLNRLKADIIFHCAAYKHVPMIESNPIEAIKNNVFGTQNIANAAEHAGVSRFVLISTDKAVNPTSVYGASKMLAENIILNKTNNSCEFMAVRFGNVLGSRGSIVPLFQKQILKGGPVTITHPDVTRFFMTIPEAASLVLKAGGVGEQNTLYILDMGKPILIKNLAEQMINFYGYKPVKDIPLSIIGLRQGEKLTESLWSSDETPIDTKQTGIKRIIKKPGFNGDIDLILKSLKTTCYFDKKNPDMYRNRRHLKQILNSYIPTIEIQKDEPEY